MKKIFFFFFSLFIISSFGERIYLKSGKIIEGKIFEKTDKYIKVMFEGVPLTFWKDEIEKIESTQPCVGELIEKGLKALKDKRFKEAIKIFQKVIESMPYKIEAYLALGRAYVGLGEYDKGIEYFNRAISIDANCKSAYISLGMVYFKYKKNYKLSIYYFKKALQIDPFDAFVHFSLGVVYSLNKEKKLALKEIEILKKLNKELAEILALYLAQLEKKNGK